MHMPDHTNVRPTAGFARSMRALALLAALAGAGPALAQDAPPADAERVVKPCIECHEAAYAITDSKHFVKGDARTPKGSGDECKACHGDTTAHGKEPRAKGLLEVTFGNKSPAAPQNERCLTCHDSGSRIHWAGSAHDRTQVACAGCHKVHAAKDPILVEETQPGVCFECHKDRRADMFKLSSHPLKTGFTGCSSCHQPHGSASRALLTQNTVNDTCFTCHADKRGPFLWEHRPATDDCTHCHNPHGSNNPPMLKVRPPYLCQSCHQALRHPGTALSGPDLLPGSTTAFHMVGRSCTNCHNKVHGSNHPSGARLQR